MSDGERETSDHPADANEAASRRPAGAGELWTRVRRTVEEALTPGQRWTSGLLLGACALVLAFGLPTKTELVGRDAPDRSSEAVQTAPPEEGADTTDGGGPGVGPAAADGPPPRGGGSEPSGDGGSTDDGGGGPGSPGPGPRPEPRPAPEFVALVEPAEATDLGASDAAIAEAFLAEASFDAEIVERSGDALCEQVADAGEVVLASTTVPTDLRDCLLDEGSTIVGHDASGGVPAASADGGALVSTRRGHTESLTDLARWGVAAEVLEGRVGIVASAGFEEQVRRAVPRMRQAGVGVRAVVYVPEDEVEAEQAVVEGANEFSSKNIETVVLAAWMEDQRRWILHESLTGSGAQHVVSDLGDAVVDESYPATFDGAVAHTSLRTPWFERDEGETPVQQLCREHWEETASTGGPSDDAQVLARAYTWCQLAWFVADPAIERFRDGEMAFAEAVREERVLSPLTSDLGPLGDDGFGPTEDAVLQWGSDCDCWSGARGFRDSARPEEERGAESG